MTMPLVRSPESVRDVEAIVEWYLEQKVPHVGVRFGRAVDDTLELLVMFPEMGSPYESGDESLRGVRFEIVRGFRNHVIFYRLTEAGLYVMRVFQGHQDIDSLI